MERAVITVSGSGTSVDPSAGKMHHAREAMAEALVALPRDAAFSILLHGEKITAWKTGPVPATARYKEAARKWLERVEPRGGAAVFDALLRAFGRTGGGTRASLRPTTADTFFLVAGGPASGGALAVEAEIVEAIERLNRLEQVVIHTVAVGETAPVGFLRALASRCGGRFARITGESSAR